MPRPVVPNELPALRLAEAEVGRAQREATARAGEAPEGEDAEELVSLYRRQGTAEVAGETREDARRRGSLMRAKATVFRQRHGDRALFALRARTAVRAEAALHGELSEVERDRLLGSFPEMMARYGLVREGETVAPRIVVRTLLEARWNAAFGLGLTEGLGPLERQAYFGWLALHATDVPAPQRLEALRAFEAAGGEPPPGALGTLLYQAGQPLRAASAFERDFEEEGTVRFRNHSMAGLAMAL